MSPAQKQERIAQSATDAAFGYFSATTAAYTHVFGECMRAWAGSIDAQSEKKQKPKSWYQPPPPAMRDPSAPTAMPFTNPAFTNPWMATGWQTSQEVPTAFSALPMAMAMITAGMPRTVAWPLAEANAATQDLSTLAMDNLNETFSPHNASAPSTDNQLPNDMFMMWAELPLALMAAWMTMASTPYNQDSA